MLKINGKCVWYHCGDYTQPGYCKKHKSNCGEYFFDTDPGNGNATPMLAFDGNFNSSIESIKGGNILHRCLWASMFYI